MKTRLINLFCIFCGLFTLCAAVFLCGDALDDRKETSTNLFFQLYRIEPKSLLGDIEQGKIAVFFPIDEEPPWPPPDQQIPVSWIQEDYLRITSALFEFIWNDTLTDWQLNGMYFNLGCTKYDIGFQSGIFTFFKNEEINGNKSRIVRIINIDPRDKTVYVTENRYYPRLADWSSITLNKNLLSAEEALQRAENAGGKEKRLSVANVCDISLLLNQNVRLWNEKWWWSVDYSRRMDDESYPTTLFSVDINPFIGEVRP